MTDTNTKRVITSEFERLPAGYNLITLYVMLHTARQEELYISEEFVCKAKAEDFEAILQTEGGRPSGDLYGEFNYRKTGANEFSIYSYTYSTPDGYLDYDIEWVEELIEKAEQDPA